MNPDKLLLILIGYLFILIVIVSALFVCATEFEVHPEPIQNQIQAMLQEAIHDALHGNPPEQTAALSFIHSDVFDTYCDFVGWNADKWRSKVNKYIERKTKPQ